MRVRGWLGACGLLAPASCKKNEPIDEAKAGGKTIANFLRITTDIFKLLDSGIELPPGKSRVATPGILGAQAINILGIASRRMLRFD